MSIPRPGVDPALHRPAPVKGVHRERKDEAWLLTKHPGWRPNPDAGTRELERRWRGGGDPGAKLPYLRALHQAGELPRLDVPSALNWGPWWAPLKNQGRLEDFFASDEYEYAVGAISQAAVIRQLAAEDSQPPGRYNLTVTCPPPAEGSRAGNGFNVLYHGRPNQHVLIDRDATNDAERILTTSEGAWVGIVRAASMCAKDAEYYARTRPWSSTDTPEFVASAVARGRRGERLTIAELPHAVWDWLVVHGQTRDVSLWTPEVWAARREDYGLDASLLLSSEGGFNYVLYYGEDRALLEEWNAWLAAIGWDLHNVVGVWAFGFYRAALENPPRDESLRMLERLAASGDTEAAAKLIREQRRTIGSEDQRAMFAARDALRVPASDDSWQLLRNLLVATAKVHTRSGVEQVMLRVDQDLHPHYQRAFNGEPLEKLFDREVTLAVDVNRSNGWSMRVVPGGHPGTRIQLEADVFFSGDYEGHANEIANEIVSAFDGVDGDMAWSAPDGAAVDSTDSWDDDVWENEAYEDMYDVNVVLTRSMELYHLIAVLGRVAISQDAEDPAPPVLFRRARIKKKRPRRSRK